MQREQLFFRECVQIFVSFYNERYDRRYVFTPKDGVHLKHILRRLKKLCEDKSVAFDRSQALPAFLSFVEMAFRDEWLRSHFEMPVLSAKFNAIAGWVARAQKWQEAWRDLQEAARTGHFLEGGAAEDADLSFWGEAWRSCLRILSKSVQKEPEAVQNYLQYIVNNSEYWTLK